MNAFVDPDDQCTAALQHSPQNVIAAHAASGLGKAVIDHC